MSKAKIEVDIISDINCPWCYLGEKYFHDAVSATDGLYDFKITLKPFELNPQAPASGEAKETYFLRNYGPDGLEKMADSNSRITAAGKDVGLNFNFDKLTKVHNTFNGHRLIWLAGKYGVQEPVAEALYVKNFELGENVNDLDLLTQIGIDSGIPAGKLDGFFEGEEGKEEVKKMERDAQQAGVRGVPAFVLNKKYLLSGAQPVEAFLSAFEQIAPKLEEIKSGDSDSESSCGIDGNC